MFLHHPVLGGSSSDGSSPGKSSYIFSPDSTACLLPQQWRLVPSTPVSICPSIYLLFFSKAVNSLGGEPQDLAGGKSLSWVLPSPICSDCSASHFPWAPTSFSCLSVQPCVRYPSYPNQCLVSPRIFATLESFTCFFLHHRSDRTHCLILSGFLCLPPQARLLTCSIVLETGAFLCFYWQFLPIGNFSRHWLKWF